MNFIKWLLVIFVSLFLFEFLYIKFSSVENIKSFEERTSGYLDSIIGISKKLTEEFQPQAPLDENIFKVTHIKYTDPQNYTTSKADKLCNDAIFTAMEDHSNKAQQDKKTACAHNLQGANK